MSPILFSPLSQRISQPSSQDQQNGKWILYRFPPSSFRINKETSSCICIDALGLYLSPDYLLNFLSNLYWLKFSNLLFQFTAKYICVSKNWILTFLIIPLAKNKLIENRTSFLTSSWYPHKSYHHCFTFWYKVVDSLYEF